MEKEPCNKNAEKILGYIVLPDQIIMLTDHVISD